MAVCESGAQAGHRNLGVTSIEMIFKGLGWDETPQGVHAHREERRPKDGALSLQHVERL